MEPIVFEKLHAIIDAHPAGWLSGPAIFRAHDEDGLPFSFIRDWCRSRGVHFDERGIRGELRVCYGWSPERIESELRD